MKIAIKFIAACAFLAGITGTFAAGNHAGGHGASAIGKPGVASQVTRTIAVSMTDAMRFVPDAIQVKQGETIRFAVTNAGQLKHEFNLGTESDLKSHYEMMKKFPEMEHNDPNLVSLAPGKTGEVVWQFTKAGKVSFACLHVGHYEAGMKGSVVVAPNTLPGNWVDGEIRKIDKEARKVTIKHGEIKQWDMPPMTMVFTVKDASLLGALKVGDRVAFEVLREEGKMLVSNIQPSK